MIQDSILNAIVGQKKIEDIGNITFIQGNSSSVLSGEDKSPIFRGSCLFGCRASSEANGIISSSSASRHLCKMALLPDYSYSPDRIRRHTAHTQAAAGLHDENKVQRPSLNDAL